MSSEAASDYARPQISSPVGGMGARVQGRLPALAGRIGDGIKSTASRFRDWLDSSDGRQVLKCTIAYTIGSLATFAPPLSNFLGKPDGKHVVATITVYFHPARSAGSMIEAIMIAIVAVAYAELISVLSMATSMLVGSGMRMVTLAHILVVVVFIGGGFGLMGWVKQRMGNPLVNVGSTLASLAIIGVVTKENHVISNVFSNEKVAQVFKILIMGITTTAAVNLLVWPQSARKSLRKSMGRASISLSEMLSLIVNGYTAGPEREMSEKFMAASSGYRTAFTKMMTDLREAKFEHYFLGNEAVYYNERSVAGCMEMLAQSLGGLRNAAHTQLSLLEDTRTSAHSSNSGTTTFSRPDLFELFIISIGPSMNSLGLRLCKVLNETPFGETSSSGIRISDDLRLGLTEALGSFKNARTEALKALYDHIEINSDGSETVQAELEEVAAACGHFAFTLQSVGEEVLKYLDILDNLDYVVQHHRRSWRWLIWWRVPDADERKVLWQPESPEADGLMSPELKENNSRSVTTLLAERRNSRVLSNPTSVREVPAWTLRKLLRQFRKLARDDIKFGLKVGIGAAIWGMFAFIEATRDVYSRWRGEWGLLSFMIVCSMTVGASNTTGWARFIGTLVGCAFSVINWKVSFGNALLLMVVGWTTSFLIFYFIVVRGKAALGRITLLAYNVSTLYAYSLSQKMNDNDDDTEELGQDPNIVEIAKHRAIAVTAGILWGLVVCRIIWPISGRRKFREGLSMLHLQMGLIWKRGPLAVLFQSQGAKSYLKSGEQVAMQRQAAKLEGLRQSAASEFDLVGPFPMEAYGRMLRGTNRILDGFYAMSLVAYRKGNLTDAEKILLQYTARERAALCDNICHAFEVLASSMMLEYPLSDATLSIVVARENLLAKIFQLRKEYSARSLNEAGGSSSGPFGITVEEKDYAVLYAYALVTGQVAEELQKLSNEVRSLVGVDDTDSRFFQG